MIFNLAGVAALLLQMAQGPATMVVPEKADAPDFSLRSTSGQEEALRNFRGKLVLLNFWATWCPPCRAEMPEFERLYRDFGSRGFVVIAVSSDALGNRDVAPFVQHLGLTFPVLLDADERVTNVYRVRLRPTTYFIDADGKLIGRVVGARDWGSSEWRGLVERLLRPSADR